MKLPKGFGKNYFTLRAITATVNQITLHAHRSRILNHIPHYSNDTLEGEEEPPETDLLVEISQKPCHCNCHFLKKTQKTLLLHPNPNYYYDYFKNLNNAISPPNLYF